MFRSGHPIMEGDHTPQAESLSGADQGNLRGNRCGVDSPITHPQVRMDANEVVDLRVTRRTDHYSVVSEPPEVNRLSKRELVNYRTEHLRVVHRGDLDVLTDSAGDEPGRCGQI
jgi:hypothetical protein